MKNILFILVLLISFSGLSQHGEIRGIAKDKSTHETIPFAKVTLHLGDSLIQTTETNIEGVYKFSLLTPRKYILKVNAMQCEELTINGVVVLADQITFQSANLHFIPTETKTGYKRKVVEIEN